MPEKYSNERYDPSLAQCSSLELRFDGTLLTMTGGSENYSFPAVSGTPDGHGKFNYDAASQKNQNSGPIPEGTIG